MEIKFHESTEEAIKSEIRIQGRDIQGKPGADLIASSIELKFIVIEEERGKIALFFDPSLTYVDMIRWNKDADFKGAGKLYLDELSFMLESDFRKWGFEQPIDMIMFGGHLEEIGKTFYDELRAKVKELLAS